MKTLILAAALMAGASLASTSPALAAAARTYDCAKAGNATKAVCKGPAKTAAKAAAKADAKAAKADAKAAKVQASAAAKVSAKPAAVSTRTAAAPRNFDCSKAGNANKTVCKGSVATRTVAASRPVPARPTMTASRTTTAARHVAAAGPALAENSSSAGAIAQCKDGLYSHAKGRTGACSRHGGVGKWM